MKLANQIYISARVDSRTPEETFYFGRKSRYPRITSNCAFLLCIPIRNRVYGKWLSVEPCKRGPSPKIKDVRSHRFCLFRMCASFCIWIPNRIYLPIFLISISNFFAMESLLTWATYSFRPFLKSFQCFAQAVFSLNSSILRRSDSVSALQVSCGTTCSINVIFWDESTVWVLADELGLEVDRVRLITGSSAGLEDVACAAMRTVVCGLRGQNR